MQNTKVPLRLIGKIAPIFAVLYTHSAIDMRFAACGYQGDPPEGNKVKKVMQWLRIGNEILPNPMENFGELIEDFMDEFPPSMPITLEGKTTSVDMLRQEIYKLLSKSGFEYSGGGKILPLKKASAGQGLTYAFNEVVAQVSEASDLFTATAKGETMPTQNKVFIVHGHSEVMVQKTARLLESFNLIPIILHEQANMGKTIIEKFERNSDDVGYAIVLMTKDDMGSKMADAQIGSYTPRARQNVLMELGYFMGKLGRGKVCVLKESGVEVPSDIFGVVYEEIDSAGAWKTRVGKELKTAGFDVDLNNL